MATEDIELLRVLPATPERIFRAWMGASEHAEFTGAPAAIDPTEGGDFEVWDGYITGTTLELRPGQLIVQAWRTTEFPEDAPDSRLEVSLEAVDGGTRVRIRHSEIPEGQGEAYRQGWGEHYLDRLQEYFGNQVDEIPVTNEETPPDGAQAPISAPAQALADAVAEAPAPKPAPAKRRAAAKRKPAKKAKATRGAKPKKRAPARKGAKKKPARRGAKRR
jgi:uncharacterized protein YndB with AHSA1/START domain